MSHAGCVGGPINDRMCSCVRLDFNGTTSITWPVAALCSSPPLPLHGRAEFGVGSGLRFVHSSLYLPCSCRTAASTKHLLTTQLSFRTSLPFPPNVLSQSSKRCLCCLRFFLAASLHASGFFINLSSSSHTTCPGLSNRLVARFVFLSSQRLSYKITYDAYKTYYIR